MVYSGKYIFPKMDIESLREMGVTFWLAQYPKEPDFTAMPDMGSSAAQPAIWQYASDGSVDGANVPTSGCVDVNVRYWVPEVESVSVTSSVASKFPGVHCRGRNPILYTAAIIARIKKRW